MTDQNSQFFAILTAVGEAKQANANAIGVPWTFTQMGVGDANMTDPVPDRAQTRLINEKRRAPLNQLKVDPSNPNIIIAEQVIPPDVGGWWIRELGLYDAAGDLVAVANCAPSFKPLLTQGTGKTQVVRLHLIVTSTANVQLKIDPAVVLATRDYVDTSILSVLPKDKALGKYTQVQINERGIVVQGFNPTTLAGYGITDALKVGSISLQRPMLAAPKPGTAVGEGGALEVREAQGVAESNKGFTYAPAILFNWSGVTTGSVAMDQYGQLRWKGSLLYHDGNFDPALKANLASPVFTGSVMVPDVVAGTSNAAAANTRFVMTAIAALVASSPAALDTLNELATALGNDPNFATTVTTALAGKAAKATTLAGYGITDAFTKTDTYNKVDIRYLIDQAVLPLAAKSTTLAGYGITDASTTAQMNVAIQTAVAALVASSPAALDTLKELATALGNDPNFAATMTAALAGKAAKATTLSGYGITDAFAKSETYDRVDIKYLIDQTVGALLPKRTFGVNDFIRIPDVPGGLIIQFGSTQVAPEATVDVTLPVAFNLHRGALATPSLDSATSNGNYSAYGRLISPSVIRLTQDVSSTTGAANQYINWWAWGN